MHDDDALLFFKKDGVMAAEKDVEKILLPCDTALPAVGMKSNRAEIKALREKFGFSKRG